MKLWIAFCTVAASLSAGAAAQAPPPSEVQSAAGRRAQEMATALASDRMEVFRSFLKASTALKPEDLESFQWRRYVLGPWTEIRITSVAANQASLTYRPAYSGRLLALQMEVDPKAPHRIVAVKGQPAPPDDRPVPRNKAESLKVLDEVAQKVAAAGLFSGVVLVGQGGQPIYQRAFGLADRSFDVPNRIDTKFNVGSMNKLFTSIGIGQLMERGKLSLDDPLAKYLPDFPDPESAKKIRITHLLSHTSGLNSYFSDEFFEANPGRYRDVATYMAAARKNAKMEFEPGTKWSYSNTGMLVLGRVLEIASGMDYYDYIRKHIYGPSGMTGSDSYLTNAVVKNRAVGYETTLGIDGQEIRSGILDTPGRGGPAGGGYSTAPDLLRLSHALGSGKLLKPETLALFSSPKPELSSPAYGYGFDLPVKGRDIAGHGGDFSDGTCADFIMTRDAEAPYTAIVLSNGIISGSCEAIRGAMRRMFPAAATSLNH
jgi:CubicO group peptidase (beta-lactamase class C family)